MIDLIRNRCTRKVAGKFGLFFVLSIAMLLPAELVFAARETNKLVSMQMDAVKGNPTLRIVTEKPIGYRYTVYGSDDLSSVVINFPHMDIDDIPSLTDVDQPPVQKVEVSSYDSTWGRLGRVEVLLSQMVDYDVAINDNEFVLTLLLKANQATVSAEPASTQTGPVAASSLPPAEEPKRASVVSVKEVTAPASKIMNVDVGKQAVTLQADGLIDNYKFFSLGGPERLVVDVYGVKPGFEARSFSMSEDFSSMRVGVYREKLRFVFDATGKVPKHAVISKGESVVISWGAETLPASAENQ